MKLRLLFSGLYLTMALTGFAQPRYQTPTPEVTFTTDSIQFKYESFEGDPLNTRKYVLSNGMTIYLSPNSREPKIQSMLVVRTGSRNDPADNTGLAHYLEHMLFKGTAEFGTKNYQSERVYLEQIETLFELHKNTQDTALRKIIYARIDSISYLASQTAIANEYDKMMQIMGVSGVNAYTSNDETVYLNTIPSNQIYKWIEIEADRFRNPVFRLFHTELEAVYEEKNRSLDNDDSKAFHKLFEGLFFGHPYGTQTTIGTVEHLKTPSIKAIENYFRKYYVPSNMALILSGDFDPDTLILVIDREFSNLLKRSDPEPPQFDFLQRRDNTAYEVYGPNPAYVMFGFRTPSGKVRESACMEVIDLLLANGKAGFLDVNLNLTQKVQSAYSYAHGMSDASAHIFVGVPRENQSPEEVRELILAEIERVKKGEFSEQDLQAIIDNKEVELLNSYKHNYARCSSLAEAFILGYSWKEYQEILNFYKTVTRQDIIDFANLYYTDPVTVYKREGKDTTIAKIAKPQIRPVELNKDKESEYLKTHAYRKVEPIRPAFIDYEKDLLRMKTKAGMDLFYVQNKENELFSLYYVLEMGSLNDLKTAFAIELLPYLGTEKYPAELLNKKFYELAASFGVVSGSDRIYVYLTGLQRNFDASLELFEHLLREAKPDQEALNDLVARTLKAREDQKKNKGSILFSAMLNYATYGKDNPFLYRLSAKQLQGLKAADLTGLIHGLLDFEHYAFYFGPLTLQQAGAKLDAKHRVPEKFKAYPKAKTFKPQAAPGRNTVYFYDFDMVQAEVLWVRNSGEYQADEVPTAMLFNEYFDGGMGTVVFQELRESKALAYSTYARYSITSRPDQPNYVHAYIGTQSDKLMDAIPAMTALFDRPPVSERDIRNAKNSLKQSIETRRVLEENIFFTYLSNQRMGRNVDLHQSVYETIDSLSVAHVAEFQQNYFVGKAFFYCILASSKRVSIKELKKIGKVKVLTSKDLFGE